MRSSHERHPSPPPLSLRPPRFRSVPGAFALALGGLVLACGPSDAPPVAEGPVVSVTGGQVRGVPADGEGAVSVFRGVPFAAPPVGDRRWRPPQPVEAWEGVHDGSRFSPACMQQTREPGSFYGPGARDMSENCLYLNVWTTASAGESRPVMVWFHGGGLRNGTASDPRFDGTALARRGVVLITAAYRLGPFGFLAHPLLSEEDERGSSGNYGLLDQIAALGWVRANAAAFGGDPERVTIFGQSAGASSVSYLMVSPLAERLFTGAIAQSGGRFRGTARLDEESLEGESAESVGERFFEALLANAADRIMELGEEVPLELETLRTFSAQEIVDALAIPGVDFRSAANVDGWALEESVYDAFAGGRQHDVPMILGWTADEGTSLAPDAAPASLDAYRQEIADTLGDLADRHHRLYPAGDDAEAHRAYYRSYADRRFGWPVWTGARLMATVSSPAYLYYFTRVPPGPDAERLGAYHSADVAYSFANLDTSEDPVAKRDYDDVDRRLAEQMADYWVSFATDGDPNAPELPEWPAFTDESGATMVFGNETRVELQIRRQQLELYDELEKRRRAERD